jgi:hypothetical protein
MKPMLWKTLALAFASAIAALATAQEHTSLIPELTRGLHGPIHSQKTTTKKLSPDPRREPKLHVYQCPAWTLFDTTGRIVEEAQIRRSDGTFVWNVRNSYDPKDDVTTRTQNGQVFRDETTTRPDGTVETSTFQDGVLVSRTEDISDKDGNTLESTSYGADGEISDRMVYHYKNGRMTELQEWGPKNEFGGHRALEYNSNGDPILATFYDKRGKPVTTFSFEGARLSSYWQDPDCGCSNNFGRRANDASYSYATRPDGSLETTVGNYSRSASRFEPSDEEVYAGDHVLAEKLAFTYERDGHANWTKRVVSAWDKKTGEMVPIEEDVRVLTYY